MTIIEMMLLGFAFFIIIIISTFYVVLTAPVGLPFLRAKLKKKALLILSGVDGQVRLIPAIYKHGTYTTSEPPYTFLQFKDARPQHISGITTLFVHDAWGIASDPEMQSSLQTLHDQGITTYDELLAAVDTGELKRDDPIVSPAFHIHNVGDILDYMRSVQSPVAISALIEERISTIAHGYLVKFEELTNFAPEKPAIGVGAMIAISVVLLILAAGAYLVFQGNPFG